LNEIFAGFATNYVQRTLPNQEVLASILEREFKMLSTDAHSFAGIIRENILEYGLTQEINGRNVIISPEMALERFDSPPGQVEPARDLEASQPVPESDGAAPTEVQPTPPQSPPPSPIVSPAGVTAPNHGITRTAEFHFNIQIHLPADASSEAYDAIFKSIATHLLGRGED